MLHLALADKKGLTWAQDQVILHHYLHKPVDVRCSPVAYLVLIGGACKLAVVNNGLHERLVSTGEIVGAERVGCLIFGRPESTKVNGWYGSVGDVASGKCRLTRWQVLNLARVWLNPCIQHEGEDYIANAATLVIAQALKSIVSDYLMEKPPVWMNEPYEIREVLSYCDTRIHHGALYKASNFRLMRTNDKGIETYMRPTRRLTHAEKADIATASAKDKRGQKLRAKRAQVALFEDEVAV